MGAAMWCDVRDDGHAFDEREAIVVTVKDDVRNFCSAHCVPAFVTAFHAARADGKSDICLPTLGGRFKIVPQDIRPGQPSGSPEEGTKRKAAGGSGSPMASARESAKAISDLLEQEPRAGNGPSAPASYGARA